MTSPITGRSSENQGEISPPQQNQVVNTTMAKYGQADKSSVGEPPPLEVILRHEQENELLLLFVSHVDDHLKYIDMLE